MFTITETTPAPTTRRLPQFKTVDEMMDKIAFKAATMIRFEDMGIEVRSSQKAALTRMINQLTGMHSSGNIRKYYPLAIREMRKRGVFTEEQIEKLYMTLQGRLGII